MDAIAHPRAAVPRPPGFLATAWDVFIGFLLAALAVGVVAFAAVGVGVLGFDSTTHERRSAVDWPFPHGGPWSVAANGVATIAVLLACAIAISRRLSRSTGEPVSARRTFWVVALTGYAPYVAYEGLLPVHFFLGLLATAFLVRRYAVGVPPMDLSRRARSGLIAAGAALLCIPAAYGATHPLWYDSEFYVENASSAPDYTTHRVVFRPRGPVTVKYGFVLESFSRPKVTLLGVSGAGTAPFLRIVRAEPGFAFPHRSPRPLRGMTIGGGQTADVTLFIRTGGCDGASGAFTLDRVHVRYRLLGVTLSQPVQLAIRPTVVCR